MGDTPLLLSESQSLPYLPMLRISSELTWWHKKAFPAFWFGFIGLWSVYLLARVLDRQLTALWLFPPICFAVAGAAAMWKLTLRLVDEVWLEGREVVVRNGGQEERIPISDFTEITVSKHCITLSLKEPTRFGREIVFSRPFFQWPPADEQLRRTHRLDALEAIQRH